MGERERRGRPLGLPPSPEVMLAGLVDVARRAKEAHHADPGGELPPSSIDFVMTAPRAVVSVVAMEGHPRQVMGAMGPFAAVAGLAGVGMAVDAWMWVDDRRDGRSADPSQLLAGDMTPGEAFRAGDPAATEAMMVALMTSTERGAVGAALPYVDRGADGIEWGEIARADDPTSSLGGALPDMMADLLSASLDQEGERIMGELIGSHADGWYAALRVALSLSLDRLAEATGGSVGCFVSALVPDDPAVIEFAGYLGRRMR